MPLSIRLTVVGLLLCILQGCSWLQKDLLNPDIKVVDFSTAKGGNLLEQRFALRLRLTNPNDLELDVKGMNFEFDVEGVELIRGVSSDVPLIKPFGEAEFTVQGTANVIQAVRLLKKLQKKPDAGLSYTLNTRIVLRSGWPSTFNLQKDGTLTLDDWLQQ